MSSLSFPKLWLRRFLIFLYLAKVPPSFFSRNTTPAPGNGINPGLPDGDLGDDPHDCDQDEECTWDDIKDDDQNFQPYCPIYKSDVQNTCDVIGQFYSVIWILIIHS